MSLPFRFTALALVGLVSGGLVFAQADAGAVTETSRTGRRVELTLRSGPHPLVGDYPVSVYLPPDYDSGTDAYPVLYIFDGYDFHAEHDTLAQENLIHPAILVAIANKTSTSRLYDLTPSVSGANTGGLAGFADLITRQLKPYLDTHFRTRPEAASTGAIGVSLGGLAACWLGYVHPEIFGLAGCLEPLAARDRIVAINDNWSTLAADRDALAATFASVGAFPLPAASLDAALLLDVEGIRTVHAYGVPTGTSGIMLVEAYDTGAGNAVRLVNVSARNHVGPGADILIAGFVLNGNVPRRLLVRGIGPGLSAYGVPDPLADPRLEVHTSIGGRDSVVATNDNWADEGIGPLRTAFVATGAFDLPDATSRDAALLLTLPAGIYTALVSGVGDTTGNALAEIYEVP